MNEIMQVIETIEECFGEDVDFCEICSAKGKCNGICCYEQIKEKFEKFISEDGSEVVAK